MRVPNNYQLAIPNLSPYNANYLPYWREQKKFCIKGYWADGYWCPPKLFFHINFYHILLNKDITSKQKIYSRPNLRDIDWEVYYNITVCRGFSGFRDDERYTCLNRLRDIENENEKDEVARVYPEVINSEGQFKEYLNPSDYIRMRHPKHYEYPLYSNEASNFMWMTSRGVGKALDLNSFVKTPTGNKYIKDIEIGDQIYDESGELTSVIAIQDNDEDTSYLVELLDGRKVITNGQHDWFVESIKTRKHHKVVMNTLQLKNEVKACRTKDYYKWYIKQNKPVLYNKRPLEIDAYLYGFLLSKRHFIEDFTGGDFITVGYISNELKETLLPLLEAYNVLLTPIPLRDSEYRLYLKNDKTIRNVIYDISSFNRIFSYQNIEDYIFNSVITRVNFLKGYLDSTVRFNGNGNAYIEESDTYIRSIILHIGRSLGIVCKTEGKNNTLIKFLTDKPIFSLSSHLSKWKKSSYKETHYVAVKRVQQLEARKTRCIEVSNDSHLFLCNDFIVTHNSYIVSSIIAHEWLFDGALDYEEYMSYTQNKNDSEDSKYKVSIIVGAGDAKYTNELLSKTKEGLKKLPGKQVLGNLQYPAPFTKQYKGSWDAGGTIEALYKKKTGGTWEEKGSGSKIKNRTFMDNPFAGQGDRNSIIVLEEVGMFGRLKDSFNAMTENMKHSGTIKFGTCIMIGTGGDMNGKGTIDAQSMFYDPENYDILAFEDKWEHKGKIAYFSPAWYGLDEFRDAYGNVDAESATNKILTKRERLKRSKNKDSLDNFIQYQPLMPSEIFLSKEGNMMPIFELKKRLALIERDDVLPYIEKKVELFYDKDAPNGVDYRIDIDNKYKAINDFPFKKEDDKEGCIVIYELPRYDDEGKVPEGLYVIGHDPYRVDGDGDSLGSIVVMKTKKYFHKHGHDEIVAVYYGRPYLGRDVVNEHLMKLSMFYNAKVYFENNVGNVKEYFEKKRRLDLLAREPQTILSKTASFSKYTSDRYGYSIGNEKVKSEGVLYIRDWLLEERGRWEDEANKMAYGEIADTNSTSTLRNLDRIYDRMILKQLISFNMKGNFDAVMGLMGCILAMEETFNKHILSFNDTRQTVDLSFLTSNKKLFKHDSISSATIKL